MPIIARKLADKFISKIQGSPVRDQIILSVFARKAEKAGVPPLLIIIARHVATRSGLQKAIAFLSMLKRLHAGAYDLVPEIMSRLSSDEERRCLMEHYPDIAEREIAATGDSTVFKWLMETKEKGLGQTEGRAPDERQVQAYARARIERAIQKRLNDSSAKSRDIKFDHSRAMEVLMEMKDIFERNGKRFFLSSGTLLGAIREKDFISNDYDIDLGVFPEEASIDECEKIMENSNFLIVSKVPYLLTLMHEPTDISVEIFTYELVGKTRTCRTEIHQWWYRDFNLVPYEFHGEEFYIPDDVDTHLMENFGNWRKKTLFYDFSYDCPNRTYTQSFEALFYLFDRTNRAFARGWRYHAQQGAQALRDFFDLDHTHCLPRPVNRKSIPLPLMEPEFAGKKVVLVASAFDCLDPEGIARLRKLARQGDFMVAAIMRDPAQADGDMRAGWPVPEMARMLRALDVVDHVVALKEKGELDALVTRLQPHKLVLDDSGAFTEAGKGAGRSCGGKAAEERVLRPASPGNG